MNNNTYAVTAQRFENTGGNCMVSTFTAWNKQKQMAFYVVANEEGCSLNTVDYINTELQELINDYGLITLDSYDWSDITHDVTPDFIACHKHEMLPYDSDLLELLLYCEFEYIKDDVKYFKRNWFIETDRLPNDMFIQLTKHYRDWLEDQDQLVETDGSKVIIHTNYYPPTEGVVEHDQYIKDCKSLLEYMKAEFAKTDIDEADEAWSKFYELKAVIGYGSHVIMLDNQASVYTALVDALEYIISQE